MSILKRNTSFFPSLRSSFPEFFDSENFYRFPVLTTNGNKPAVNIKENESDFEIEMAAPGLSKKDFQISIENGMLNISVQKEEEKVEEKKNYTSREFSYSSFSRSFSLPDNVDEDQITAKYQDGILNIKLQKTKTTVKEKAREISVS